ncbi:hypothetical protein ACVNF4_30515 [Streptomyces sp. S6]
MRPQPQPGTTAYRNRPLRALSFAMVAGTVAAAVSLLFLDSPAVSGAREAAQALALPSGCAWVFVRIGLLPQVRWGEGRLTVVDPFVVYEASLSDVRLLARAGRGGSLLVGGVEVRPWAMTRSLFDGRRAGASRRELRNAVRRAERAGEGPSSLVRRPLTGWYDVLVLPVPWAVAGAFLC